MRLGARANATSLAFPLPRGRPQLLRGTTGAKITKLRAPSFTDTPSIQGFWNPFEQYPGLRKAPPAPRA